MDGLVSLVAELKVDVERLRAITDCEQEIDLWSNSLHGLKERHQVRTGPDVKNVLYTAAGENGPTWSLWQKEPGETRGRPLGFWSRGYRGSEARYTPTEKEILAAYEGVRSASEVVGTEAQLLLAPRLPNTYISASFAFPVSTIRVWTVSNVSLLLESMVAAAGSKQN
ncbi:Charged multivesicular body protein 2b [Aix galericulata]|nr:Charged multivesicular body protein 2b [Aix galericulata]